MKLKTILSSLLLLAATAYGYNVTFSGNAGYGMFYVDNEPVFSSIDKSGFVNISFVSTNSLYECDGIVVNGSYKSGQSPWLVNIPYNTTISPIIHKKPPSGFSLPGNMMAISADCPDSGWGKIIFNSPTTVQFVDDGQTYLFPSPINCLTIKAVGGDIEVNTTTNSTQVIATMGEDATVPIAPALVEEGNSLVINLPIGELYFKGSGKINVIGVKDE